MTWEGSNKIEADLRAALYLAQNKTEKYAVKIVDLRQQVDELQEELKEMSTKAFEFAEEGKKLYARLNEALRFLNNEDEEISVHDAYNADVKDELNKILRGQE